MLHYIIAQDYWRPNVSLDGPRENYFFGRHGRLRHHYVISDDARRYIAMVHDLKRTNGDFGD